MTDRGRLGRHVPISNGLIAAIRAARDAGYDSVQVFPGNPKGWHHVPLPPEGAAAVRAEAAELDMAPVVIHAPYIINIASPDDEMARKSARGLANALARAGEIGARYVVVHAGSHRGEGEDAGIARAACLVETVLAGAPEGVELLIENSAGAGNVLAGTPEGLGRMLAALPPAVGTCIDTAHLWGAGCAIDARDGVDRTIDALDRAGVLMRLRVLHVNDSAVPLGSHRDVHAHCGEGSIGLMGLSAWMTHPALGHLPVILETPPEDDPEREAARCQLARRLQHGDVDGAAACLAALASVDTET